ncbi:MAG: pyruvate dehydrogenase (acetyl-transferring) E1 component subunit alpha [Deltaproteobacteria bacterium]|nr:pyruvate dehydrogenase (acetyl-transferring) E1 component subunit alpha [Deltaproteobacteria bacterium]
MPKKTLKSFAVEWLQVLDEQGNCDEMLRPALSDAQLQKLYEWMILIRTFDEKAFNLQRQGRLGTYAPVHGHEATQVGSAFALQPSDWVFASYRDGAVYGVRGLPLAMIFQYWAGDERGMQIPKGENDFPMTIQVGTQIPLAVGAAYAAKLRKEAIAVAVYFGDGATSKGDFHEGLNFAGVHRLPIVFICENNHYAISVPLKYQTGSDTLAQKAIAYGFTGIQVDGNDALGVYRATLEALEKARKGEGPTLIECFTYRMGDHTTADDASRYRSAEEVQIWQKKDPVERFEKYLESKGIWNKSYEEKVRSKAQEEVAQVVREFESLPPPDPEDMIRYTFDTLPPDLAKQMENLKSS